MSLESDIALLSRVSLFEGFAKEHLRLIAFGADKRSFIPGTVIFRRNAYADGGYVIVRGSIDLVSGDDVDAQSLGRFGQASLIGELALISEINRNEAAIAVDDVEVIKITRALFHRMLGEYPDLAVVLHQRISGSVQNFVSKLEIIRRDLDRADIG